MVFYMNFYRKCDFLCEGCVEFYYDRRRQEMLGIQKIVLKSTMLPISHFAINVNYMNGITLSLLKNGDKYLLCNGCVKFFKNIKNKEMAGIKDIEKVR